MMKELSEIIHGFIRKNRYKKSIYFCDFCGRPIMRKEVFIYINKKEMILCSHCDFSDLPSFNRNEKEYLIAHDSK